MKQLVIGGLVLLFSAALTSCQSLSSETVQSQINSIKEEAADKAVSDIKNSLLSQIDAFMQNDTDIGLTDENAKALENSINDYLDNYDWNTDELENAKKEISSFLEEIAKQADSSHFTKDELNHKLNEILNQ